MSNKIKDGGMHAKRVTGDIITYIFLIVLSVIWLIPFFWLVMQSFRDGKGQFISTFLPKAYTVNNYKALFTQFDVMNFPRMFMNTFFIACCTCVISTFFVLSVAYCTSRLKWKMRKPYMNMAMILNLFPGFMTMIAVYFILKALGMTEGNRIPLALIICFSSGSGTGFFVMKGFMDTIPKALDEAATLDGCTRWQIFTKITLPLSKPMIVYQIITSVHGTLGGLRVRKGHCRSQFAVLHGLHRPVEHAGKGIRRYLVRPLLRRRGAGVHPHCDPVHDHPEILSGGNERRSQGLMPGLPRPMHPERRTPLWKLPGNDLPASAAMGCGHGGCSFFWPGCWAKASCRTVC